MYAGLSKNMLNVCQSYTQPLNSDFWILLPPPPFVVLYNESTVKFLYLELDRTVKKFEITKYSR